MEANSLALIFFETIFKSYGLGRHRHEPIASPFNVKPAQETDLLYVLDLQIIAE